MGNGIRFNKFAVVGNGVKARVHYSVDNRIDARKCVTIYHRDYTDALAKVFAGCGVYRNDGDSMTDYFDAGRVVLFSDHPLYKAARARAESVLAEKRAALEAA